MGTNQKTAPLPTRTLPGPVEVPQFVARLQARSELAATTNRRAVETDVAASTFFAATGQGVAAGMQNAAGRFVAAQAGDTAPVLGVLTPRHTAGEVALADGHAIECAAAGAHAAGEHLAEVLQSGASDVVVATAVNLEAPIALFELNVAPRHDTPILSGGERRGTRRPSGGTRRNRPRHHVAFHQDSTGHQHNSFRLADASGMSSRQLRCSERMASP